MSDRSRARKDAPTPGGKLSIGALSRATGIPIETLRTWELRYGFPVPERKPSGHRVYAVTSVPRLRRIAEALGRGHRAGEVVAASDAALAELLDATAGPLAARTPMLPLAGPPAAMEDVLQAVRAFDGDRLTRLLLADWASMGPLDFLRNRVAPLIRTVGDAWEAGTLEVRHEHFLSERVGDVLRALRLRFEERASGPLVVFASLPDEGHGLGLQMAALVLASAGCRILFLGTITPVNELATLAKDTTARVVAVSVSSSTRGPASAGMLARLRYLLPQRTTLLVGGDGAPRPRDGIVVVQDLERLDHWGRHLVATGSPPAPEPARRRADARGRRSARIPS